MNGYLGPEGCDYISLPSYTGDRGSCNCAPGWGHNAKTWENYQQVRPFTCNYVLMTLCGCMRELVDMPYPPHQEWRVPITLGTKYPTFGGDKYTDYSTRIFKYDHYEFKNLNGIEGKAYFKEKL
jgi:hypothetical protein